MCFVNLDKSLRWVEWHWEDHVSLPRDSLLLYTRMAGAAHSWWWGKVTQQQVFVQKCNTYLICVSLPDNTAHIWVKNCRELLPSSYNTSRFDQPLQAVEWLRNFRTTNEHFLPKVWAPFHAGRLFGSEFKVKMKKKYILTHCHWNVPKKNKHNILSVFTLAEFQVFELISKKHLFLLIWVNNTVPFLLDKDNTALCLDKKRVHWGGKTPQRASGAGESPRSTWNKVRIPTRKVSFESFCHYLAVGYHSREDQQRCGGSCAEGAEAAVRAARLRVPHGRGGGRRQRPVGKVHHQEGRQECCKKSTHFYTRLCGRPY